MHSKEIKEQTKEMVEEKFTKEIQKQSHFVQVHKLSNSVFIICMVLFTYLLKNNIGAILKVAGSFVGGFELVILPVAMLFVINKRYSIVSIGKMYVLVVIATLLATFMFISFGQTV